MSSAPARPIMRYHGGKWRIAPWVIRHFPSRRVYVEPFGGAASVLMRKVPSYSEVYNDMDGEVVNVFRTLRNHVAAEQLAEQLRLTPYARAEFEFAYAFTTDPIERARRTIVKAFMGFGSNAVHCSTPRGMRTAASTYGSYTGFRANAKRRGSTPASDWARFPESIQAFCARLQGVVIEQRDAVEIIGQHDGPDTLFYVDPPYPLSTRGGRIGYRDELSDDDHRQLAQVLRSVRGMVVLSGYPCTLYDEELYPDWQRVDRAALADGARKRTEVLWLNERAAAGIQGNLFAGEA